MALGLTLIPQKTNTNNEIWIYYSLQPSFIQFYAGNSGNGNVQIPVPYCAGVPAGPVPPSQATINCGGQDGANVGAIGPIPARSALYSGCDNWVFPTIAGDMAWHVVYPTWGASGGVWNLLCYDTGFKTDPGVVWRAIPNKFNTADHFVRQRPENKITLGGLFVGGQKHLQRLRGQRVTLAVAVTPAGMGQFSEIQIYGNVMLNIPLMNSASDGNASVEIQAEGTFDWCGVFTGSF
jgi:hypothetical protein